MTPALQLGIYAHHHGAGHLARAAAIARAWEGRVTVLTSTPPLDLGGSGIDVVLLPPDGGETGTDTPEVLHHAPLGDDGLRERMARIAGWINAARPDVVLVDVSVEVALLTRLHGVPTAVVRQPGRRDDEPHRLCYELADLVIAPWGEPGERDGVVHVGLVSRFDDRPRRFGRTGDDTIRVVVAVGSGGTSLSHERLVELADALPPDHRLEVLGVVPGPVSDAPHVPTEGWVHDPWPALVGADVVISSASLNLVAEVAAAGTPQVVVPEERPHGEQEAHARVLEELWGIPRCDGWGAQLVPHVLAARRAGPRHVSDRQGAGRAAEALAKLATAAAR